MSNSQVTSSTRPGTRSRIKAVFFDFMGTCLDWHTGAVKVLPEAIPEPIRSSMALDWRQAFFDELHARSQQGLIPEEIDVTHRRTLLRIIDTEPYKAHRQHFLGDDELARLPADGNEMTKSSSIEKAVRSWHSMVAWPDVLPALTALKRDLGQELFVLANGTTRLQLDLVLSSGLAGTFSMLFSSELLGVYKPAPEAYLKALKLVGVRPEEALMVAAHAYDLRAARQLGMNTAYVYRWTDDVDENTMDVKADNDTYLGEGGMRGLVAAVAALG